MSSDLLVGTYKRYKTGTNKLLAWLSSAAEQASCKSCPTKSPLKKKKQARSKRLAVDQLVTLAQSIVVATDPSIDIPIDILDVTKDAINGRQWACEWYTAFTTSEKDKKIPEEIAASNEQHRHFLKTLEKVFEILRVEFRKRQPKRKKKIELATDKEDFGNLYLHLELEETTLATDPEHAPRPSKKSAPAPPPTEAEVELEGDFASGGQGEKFFALWCILKDLWELRMENRKMLQQYVDGDISFLVACQTFDKSVRIARNLSWEFIEEQAIDTFEDLMRLFGDREYMWAARAHQIQLYGREKADDKPAHDSSIPSQAEFMLMPAWCAINDFLETAELLKSGNQQSNSAVELATIYPMHPFSKALVQLAGELEPFTCMSMCDPAEKNQAPNFLIDDYADAYTISLIDLIDFKIVGPGLLAATMMYMDLYDVLGGDLQRGLRECTPILERMRSSLEGFEAFYEKQPDDLKASIMTPVMLDILRTSHSMVRVVKPEGGAEGWHLSMDPYVVKDCGLDPDSSSVFVPIQIIATLPILAGNAVTYAMHKMQTIDMAVCNFNNAALAVAHLYRAARWQGSLTRDWPDMSSIIVRENEITKFVRPGDGTIRGVALGFCMALGMSLIEVAGAHRPPLPRPSAVKKGAVKMANLTHFMMADGDNGRAKPRKGLQYALAGNLALRQEVNLCEMYSAVNHYSNTAGIKDEALARQWRDSKKVSGSQLSQLMQEIFTADDVYSNFDFLRLYRSFVGILSQVIEHWANFGTWRPVNRKSNKQQVPRTMYEIIYEVLWEAAAGEQADRDPKKTLLFSAGEIMEDVISKEGDVGQRSAQELSSGYIPDQLKPAVRYGSTAVALLPIQMPQTIRIRHFVPEAIKEEDPEAEGSELPGQTIDPSIHECPSKEKSTTTMAETLAMDPSRGVIPILPNEE